MLQVIKKTKKLIGNVRSKSPVTGYVELFDHFKIEGWAISKSQLNLDLKLKINDAIYSLEPDWFYREDIAETYGADFGQAGFYAELPDSVKNLIEHKGIEHENVMVIASGKPLSLATKLPKALEHYAQTTLQQVSQTAEAAQQKVLSSTEQERQNEYYYQLSTPSNEFLEEYSINKNKEKIGYLNNVWGFCLYGTVIEREAKIQIKIGKKNAQSGWNVLSQHVATYQNEELEQQISVSGFSAEIPGYVWDQLEGDSIELEVIFDQGRTSPLAYKITKAKAVEWLNAISQLDEGADKQYYSLIAIEHLRFLSVFDELDIRAQSYFQQFAEKMQLETFLKKGLDSTKTPTPIEKYSVGLETQILWRLQKELNQSLQDNPQASVFSLVEKVLKKSKQGTALQQDFIKSIIPLLCKHDELMLLKQYVNLNDFASYKHDAGTWEISLALGPMIAEKKILQASDALWKIAQKPHSGWLNTECILFATKHMHDLERQGLVQQVDAEKFKYALLGLFDALGGEWFSRQHDLMLVKTMVELLSQLDFMTDYQRQDVILAATKHYGLVPSFWQEVTAAKVIITETLFKQSQQNWQVIKQAFENITHPEATNSNEFIRALAFFHRKIKNADAISFYREWLIARKASPSDAEHLDDVLLDQLFENDVLELVRFAANPSVTEETSTALLEQNQSEVFKALRMHTERANAQSFNAQLQASSHIKANNTELDLEAVVTPLNNWNAMFLGIDVLAKLIQQGKVEITEGMMHLDAILQSVIYQSKRDFFLPAPVCTALSTLDSLPDNVMFQEWLVSVKELVSAKFGHLHTPVAESELPKVKLCSPGWPQDTLVVIYSCRAYLNSRIKAIRETWIKDLKARNIPYVILVGDGDDKINGDVLELNVSDTYEDLPLKTLKMFDWVYQNTNAQYVLKIDDDCYLDVEQYFDSLSYRKHHYYGRVIHRHLGGMDRTWHHSKSKTQHAQNAIDKSPEPSIYCDGGGGYTLSRIAMQALNKTAKTIEGKRLIANSFMEDKLVGDLLSFSHIQPSNEDYECYQRRRTFGAATPVGMTENIFFPSQSTPTVVTHLDTDIDQVKTQNNVKKIGLLPYKIWPTCWTPSIKFNSNQLELISGREQSLELTKKVFFVIAAMRNEMIMLPHFLKHYRDMGVESFIISDNCSDDGTREYLLEQPDVILYSVDTEYKYSHYGVAWQQAMLANHCVGKWALIADADELLVYPNIGKQRITEFVKEAEQAGANCIRTDMIDMYPFGDLSEADFTKDAPFEVANWHDKKPLTEWYLGSGFYSNAISSTSALRHRIDQNAEPNAFTSQKYALIKYYPWVRLSQGIHDISGVKVYKTAIQFAHFKYHAGFKEKIEEEIKRKQHYDGAKEYKRYASMLAEAKGGFGEKNISIQMESNQQ